MADRSLLGGADVSDEHLRAMVAHQLDTSPERLGELTCDVEEVAYDIPAITTAGRWWVRGTADTGDGEASFAFFVKAVQAWERSPVFQYVPEELREFAASSFPFRTEGAAYRSDLADRLPPGLRMPTAYDVHEIDDRSYALWLEAVPAVTATWDLDRYRRAARLLGRMAASRDVAPLALVGDFPFRVRDYVEGRLANQVVPALRSDVWQHPAIAATWDPELRERVLASLDHLAEWADEADALPPAATHGDACPNNLLVTPLDPDGFVLIDYGLWNALPVGFDLGQLLVGDVVIGRRPSARLAETEAAIVPAYVEGLRAEGSDVGEATVRRGHALMTYLFNGVSALPFEELDLGQVPDALAALAAERAAVARFCLDLVDAT
ncbi:phosphotransferase [Nocardioides iriomotensis]|uniref:Aminoglycoside phosphotransferase domain-containing protein n=1 Tax=Nocardioides iriomotensis TaxID=715784 RepID=A0A4Q5JCH0_9ACTN|nr:phosphotransferase [Nocardioides iriomotensis]RYU15585.1 hypothetical protein ETU37_00235 [Nocardioides iriomotensis]